MIRAYRVKYTCIRDMSHYEYGHCRPPLYMDSIFKADSAEAAYKQLMERHTNPDEEVIDIEITEVFLFPNFDRREK